MKQEICSSEELIVDQPRRVVLNGEPIAVVRDNTGQVFAIGDTCSHGNVSLSEGFVEDNTLECWAHGSKFSLTTGKALTLPAYEPVPVYEIYEEDGKVFVDPTKKTLANQA